MTTKSRSFMLSAELSPRAQRQRQLWQHSFEGCPICGTEKQYLANSKILSSSCCGGVVLCESCLTNELSKQRPPHPCPSCGEHLRLEDFDEKNIHRQRYERELALADLMRDVFNQQRADFDTDDAWNAYLEAKQEFLYDLVYGRPSERKAAKERLKAYERANQQSINRATQRQHALVQNQSSSIAPRDSSYPEDQPMVDEPSSFTPSHLPSLLLPSVVWKKIPTSSIHQQNHLDWARIRQAEERRAGVQWWLQKCLVERDQII